MNQNHLIYRAGSMKQKSAESENAAWAAMSYEEKNRDLFLRQRKTLAMFLERGAITQVQHDKSLHDLIEKMGMEGTVNIPQCIP